METINQQTAPTDVGDDLFVDTPIGVLRSMQTFMRDLPTLLANPKYDRWCVCYHGEERIGIAESAAELMRECMRRGFLREDFYIGIITPKDPDEWTGLFLPR